MDSHASLDVLFRWFHVGAAITMLGGSLFLLLVLMPASAELPESEHDALRGRVMGRWRKIVAIAIGILLVSGFYNYLMVGHPSHRNTASSGLYGMLMGIKILLSFAVFFLASALTGRAPAFEPIRRNAKKWLTVTVLLAVAVVAIAGYLKVAVKPGAATVQVTEGQ